MESISGTNSNPRPLCTGINQHRKEFKRDISTAGGGQERDIELKVTGQELWQSGEENLTEVIPITPEQLGDSSSALQTPASQRCLPVYCVPALFLPY